MSIPYSFTRTKAIYPGKNNYISNSNLFTNLNTDSHCNKHIFDLFWNDIN
jgi:hypothetical protein